MINSKAVILYPQVGAAVVALLLTSANSYSYTLRTRSCIAAIKMTTIIAVITRLGE
jgi:hypothetical protein